MNYAIAAYVIIWAVFFGYIVLINHKISKLEQKIFQSKSNGHQCE